MSKKNKHQDYNLKDYIWEEEEFTFQPKTNRHKKFLHAKMRQLEKEKYVNERKRNLINNYLNNIEVIKNDHERYVVKLKDAERRIAYEDYDLEDDNDFVRYRIK